MGSDCSEKERVRDRSQVAPPGERTRNGQTVAGDGERFTKTQAKGPSILSGEKGPQAGPSEEGRVKEVRVLKLLPDIFQKCAVIYFFSQNHINHFKCTI